MFYVYGYYEADSLNPFYIGKGFGDRMWEHFTLWQLSKDDLFHHKLRRLILDGIPVHVRQLFVNLTEEEAFDYEIRLIALYGRRDLGTGCLCNLTDGGQGPSGWVPSQETRDKIGRANTGREKTLDERIRRSQIQSGVLKSEEHKAKIRATHVERTAQPVESFDLRTGLTIKIYSSAAEAARDGYGRTTILQIINGTKRTRRSHRGLGWRRPSRLSQSIDYINPDSFANRPFAEPEIDP